MSSRRSSTAHTSGDQLHRSTQGAISGSSRSARSCARQACRSPRAPTTRPRPARSRPELGAMKGSAPRSRLSGRTTTRCTGQGGVAGVAPQRNRGGTVHSRAADTRVGHHRRDTRRPRPVEPSSTPPMVCGRATWSTAPAGTRHDPAGSIRFEESVKALSVSRRSRAGSAVVREGVSGRYSPTVRSRFSLPRCARWSPVWRLAEGLGSIGLVGRGRVRGRVTQWKTRRQRSPCDGRTPGRGWNRRWPRGWRRWSSWRGCGVSRS